MLAAMDCFARNDEFKLLRRPLNAGFADGFDYRRPAIVRQGYTVFIARVRRMSRTRFGMTAKIGGGDGFIAP
jgi:hypothetical protein